jgi:hypothetical protein
MQLLSYADLGTLIWWQLGYIIFSFLVLLHIGMLIFVLPDSPHWYYERGQIDQAKRLMRKIIVNPGAVVEKAFRVKEEVRIDPDSRQGSLIAMRTSYTVLAAAISTSGFDFTLNYSITLNVTTPDKESIIIGFSFLLITLILNSLVVLYSECKSLDRLLPQNGVRVRAVHHQCH